MLVASCGGGKDPTPQAARPAQPVATRTTTDFAKRLGQAYEGGDAAAAAALFADDAVVQRIGDLDGEALGRKAIEAGFRRTFSRHKDAGLSIGRIWVGAQASVVEYVFTGTRTPSGVEPALERPIGLVGAFVVTFDRSGRVRALRDYLDESTMRGQMDLRLLPTGMKVRAVTGEVPAGRAVLASTGSPEEARNLAVSDAIWSALTAHRADDALAPMSADYVYEDFAAPLPLDRAATLELVTRFLALLPDFAIAARPVEFAAGDHVVTEVVEHATVDGAPITLHGLDVRRFRAGKVVLEWQYSNYAEVLRELHRTPLPP